METVKAIMASPTSPTEGVGVMKGQMIAAPVKIVAAKKLP
jgi:peptidyl-prolyl cis-trans isomerase A (cyclophilin A)